MMSHFEEIGGPDYLYQGRLRRPPYVSGQQHLQLPVDQAHHQGVLVGLEMPFHPALGGVEDLQPHRVQLYPITGSSRLPPDPLGLHGTEMLQVEPASQRLPGVQDQIRLDPFQHRRYSSQMVGVAVRHQRQGQPLDSHSPEKRHHHGPAGVKAPKAGPGVHQAPASARCPKHHGVSLTDVQEEEIEARVEP